MKRKIFFWVGIIILILLLNFTYFVVTAGSLSDDPPSLGEKISLAFAHPFWLSPSYIIVISVSNPIFTLFLIILCVVFYYLYDNFIKNKKEVSAVISEGQVDVIESRNEIYDGDSKIEFFDEKTLQAKTRDRLFKKIVLFATPVIILYVLFVISISSGPGEGMVGLVFLLPIMPVIYIFYPVYFIILSVRYSKEKSGMDPLDKIMFYVLLVPFIILAVFVVYRIYAGNLIQKAFDNNSNVKQVVEKQTGPTDLVVKDFSVFLGGANIKFCNESTNATGKKVAIKVETDKGFSDILENYPSLQPGECEVAQIVNENYLSSVLRLKKGESVEITVTVDPKNKIIETNEENNALTKKFDL